MEAILSRRQHRQIFSARKSRCSIYSAASAVSPRACDTCHPLEAPLLLRHPSPCALQAEFLEYQAAGDPARPTHGDYFAGKGVGVVRISTPAGPIQVPLTSMDVAVSACNAPMSLCWLVRHSSTLSHIKN